MSEGSPVTMRDLLFGDLPPARWPDRDDLPGEPWQSFLEAGRLRAPR